MYSLSFVRFCVGVDGGSGILDFVFPSRILCASFNIAVVSSLFCSEMNTGSVESEKVVDQKNVTLVADEGQGVSFKGFATNLVGMAISSTKAVSYTHLTLPTNREV